MRTDQQPAYTLHLRPYRETSVLLECLTRDFGRIGVVARGVRRDRSRLQRSQLEPFQRLRIGFLQRGELATLTAAEADGLPLRLAGQTGLSGLYLNELVVRMTARQDPQPSLFDAYASTLGRLAAGHSPAWTLRRFERDLLGALGYALQLDREAGQGAPIDPATFYRYQAEEGPVRSAPTTPRAVLGADLIALHEDVQPVPEALSRLRVLMREVIRHHLGGGELRAWRVLGSATRGR